MRDERTLKTAYHIAQACDSQNQQKNFANLVDSVPTLASLSHGTTSKCNANKVAESIYPSLPQTRDCASDTNPTTADNLKIGLSQPVVQNVLQFNFTSGNFIFKIFKFQRD